MVKSKQRYLVAKTTIAIIEEAGKPILQIPQDELLERVDGLSILHFQEKGVKCYLSSYRRHFKKLILEGRLPGLVAKIKNLDTKKPRKYQLSINSKNRTRYEIKTSILTESENGLKKSHIMCGCNLSYEQTVQYLDELLRLNLLVKKKDIYKTTDLGLDFIHVFQQLRKFLSGKKTDEPTKLNKKSRELAISALHEIKGNKTVYDHCALILERASVPTKTYDLRKASTRTDNIHGYIEFLTGLKLLKSVDTDKFKTTPLGSQYLEEHLNFILYNYLG